MTFKVRIARRAMTQIQGWQLPDKILVEVSPYLQDDGWPFRPLTAVVRLVGSPLQLQRR